jgi:hypothetical protein
MITKICSICGIEKGIECFWKDKSKKDGYRNACKECENKRKEDIKHLPRPIKRTRNNSGERNPMFGKHHSEATKKILSEKSKIFMHSEKGRNIPRRLLKGANNPMFGKHHSNETKRKIGLKSIGRVTLTDNQKKQRSEEMKGENNPFYGKRHAEETRKLMGKLKIGTHPSIETRMKQSKMRMGKKQPESMKIKLSEKRKGENNPAWKGGTSFLPYCPKFNKELKRNVRDFFGDKCVLCERTKEENVKELSVHHVFTEKMACCENKIEEMELIRERLPQGVARFGEEKFSEEEIMCIRMMVPLCISCHSKQNNKSEQLPYEQTTYRKFFTELILNEYGGVCYIEKT